MQNPWAAKVAELNARLKNGREQIDGLESELNWHREFDSREAIANATELDARVAARRIRVADLEKKLDPIARGLPKLEEKGAYGWNPGLWFSAEKRMWRQKAQECKQFIGNLDYEIRNAKKAVEIDATKADEIHASISKHEGFDKGQSEARLATLLLETTAIASELENARTIFDRAQAAMAPHVAELRDLETQSRALRTKLESAISLETDLSSAANSFEKMKIHKECERIFDEGSPSRVIRSLNGQNERIERDIGKVKVRLSEVVNATTRDIRKVVFDGSNLCIANQGFIGLAALRPAALAVAHRAKSVVVFDRSMRARLKMSNYELQTAFGPTVTVHVADGAADETVLDLATDATSYVVSNDRFADFKDKSAVMDGRVIRHEIAVDRVFLRGGLDVAEDLEQAAHL